MTYRLLLLFCSLCMVSCVDDQNKPKGTAAASLEDRSEDLVLVFASCNDQEREQPLWEPILKEQASVFIWGGDNIYADTNNADTMQAAYDRIYNRPEYVRLRENTRIMGTWDDHDYGLGDGGVEWEFKEEAKRMMLDFLEVSEEDPRRNREGVYHSEMIHTEKGSVKVILLDTRSFRTALQSSDVPGKRYAPWPKGHQGTVLGEAQWQWLRDELGDTEPDFTLIVSSIQFLSDRHGWEMWANFPDEVERLYAVLNKALSPNIILLSGDRHMGEISVNRDWGKAYPLIDFTSSGLTHVYVKAGNAPNPYRESNIVKRLNYGVLRFDFTEKKVVFELRGLEGFLFERLEQSY